MIISLIRNSSKTHLVYDHYYSLLTMLTCQLWIIITVYIAILCTYTLIVNIYQFYEVIKIEISTCDIDDFYQIHSLWMRYIHIISIIFFKSVCIFIFCL